MPDGASIKTRLPLELILSILPLFAASSKPAIVVKIASSLSEMVCTIISDAEPLKENVTVPADVS